MSLIPFWEGKKGSNLIDLRDINFTGIKRKFYYLKPDGQYYVNKEEISNEKRETCVIDLKRG